MSRPHLRRFLVLGAALLLLSAGFALGASSASAAAKYQCTCTAEAGCTIAKKKGKTESVANGTVRSVGKTISGEGWSCAKPQSKASTKGKKAKQEKQKAAKKSQGGDGKKAAKREARKEEKAESASSSGAKSKGSQLTPEQKAKREASKKEREKKQARAQRMRNDTGSGRERLKQRQARAEEAKASTDPQTASVGPEAVAPKTKKKTKKKSLKRRKGQEDSKQKTALKRRKGNEGSKKKAIAKRKGDQGLPVVQQASNVVPASEVYDSSRFSGSGGSSATHYKSPKKSKPKAKRRAKSSSSKKSSSKKDDDDDDDSGSSSADSGSSKKKKKSVGTLFVRQLIKRGSVEEDDDGNLRFTAAPPVGKERAEDGESDSMYSGEYDDSEYAESEAGDYAEDGSESAAYAQGEDAYEGESGPDTDVATPAIVEFPDLEELPIPEMYPIDGEFEGPEFAGRPGLSLQKEGSLDFWVAAGWEEPEWVMPEEGEDVPYVPVLLQADVETFGFEVSISPYWDALAISTNETYEEVEYDFSDGAPYHVALVAGEGGTDVFIDGEQVGEDLALDYASAGEELPLSVGPAPFMGWIGGIRLWNEPVPANRLHNMSRDDDFMLQHRRDYGSLTAYLKNDPEGELAGDESDLVMAGEEPTQQAFAPGAGDGEYEEYEEYESEEGGSDEAEYLEEDLEYVEEEPAEPFVPKNKW